MVLFFDDSQFGASCPRIFFHFCDIRDYGFFGEEYPLSSGEFFKTAFDDPVFKTMKRDDSDAPAGRQPLPNLRKHFPEIPQLVVRRDAKGLETSCRRMCFPAAVSGGRRFFDYESEFSGSFYRFLSAVLYDRFREPSRVTLLAVSEQDIRDIFFFPAVYDICRSESGVQIRAECHPKRLIA